MQRPNYTFPSWKKTCGFVILGVMILSTILVPSTYVLWVNGVCILALLLLFYPIIPESFRQGCNSFGYALIALCIFALLIVGGGLLFQLCVKPVY
ncbi:MAG: hypothetical protein NC127_03295 [Muribaculum sp.]|nr:hypothetical protein [Muribaculum sp.]